MLQNRISQGCTSVKASLGSPEPVRFQGFPNHYSLANLHLAFAFASWSGLRCNRDPDAGRHDPLIGTKPKFVVSFSLSMQNLGEKRKEQDAEL